jgi:hypothetical protein
MTVETTDEVLVVRYQPVDADRALLLDLSGWPGTVELRAAFAQALRHVTGPVGTWQRTVTVSSSMWAVKALVVWLAEQGVGSVAGFTPAVWNAWRLQLTAPPRAGGGSAMSGRERLLDSRVAALALPGLRTDTGPAIEMRIGRVHQVGEKPFYTKEQFEAIGKAAMQAVWSAHRRITANWRLLSFDDADAAALPARQQRKRAALRLLMRHGELRSGAECIAVGGSP